MIIIIMIIIIRTIYAILWFPIGFINQSSPAPSEIYIQSIKIPCILTSNLHNMNEFGHFARVSRTSVVTVEIEFD